MEEREIEREGGGERHKERVNKKRERERGRERQCGGESEEGIRVRGI